MLPKRLPLIRTLIRSNSKQFHNSSILYKENSNDPKFDESELFARRITTSEYQSKKTKSDYEWSEASEDGARKKNQDRMEKMAKLTAMFQGMLFISGLGVAGSVYSKWPSIQGWWIEKQLRYNNPAGSNFKRKQKKKTPSLPVIPSTQLGPEVPGVYYCGEEFTAKENTTDSLFPLRVEQFDNMTFRDIYLGDGTLNLAIDKKGNLLQWNANSSKLILADQDFVKIKCSNSCAYVLNRSGQILIVPLYDESLRSKYITKRRSILFPWKTYTQYDWKLDTGSVFLEKGEKYITQFDTGLDHLILISNKGRTYTCSTGITTSKSKSKGQFGIPTLSQFDALPQSNILYEIELLNKGLDDSQKVFTRTIDQVACGSYHTIARDSFGNIFSFGSNMYGQLGLPISIESEQVPFPKQVGKFNAYFTRDEHIKCIDLHCTDETSFATISTQSLQNNCIQNQMVNKKISFAFGNGLYGALGNGNYKNSQFEPTPIKILNDANMKIIDWSCGSQHVFCKLESGEVLAWGNNSNGQLGTGKKLKACRPQSIPELLKAGERPSFENMLKSKLILNNNQQIVTGPTSSCFYWKV